MPPEPATGCGRRPIPNNDARVRDPAESTPAASPFTLVVYFAYGRKHSTLALGSRGQKPGLELDMEPTTDN